MSLASFAEQITHFCRTGIIDATLQLDCSRLQIYQDRFRKKIDLSLKRAFPLTRHLLSDGQWHEILTAFLAEGQCGSPFFWAMPQAFVGFTKKQRYAERLDIPYLEELIDFEWLEIEMYMMADHPQELFVSEGELLDQILYLNPESRIVSYCYPVFEKKPLPRPMKKGSYFLFAFRHFDSKEIHFIGLFSLFKQVLELLKKEELSSRQILKIAAEQFKLDQSQVLLVGEKFLKDLLNQGAIHGFKERHL